jgi:pilus assembly protein CpaE
MLKAVIICPDAELAADLKDVLQETHRVAILRELKQYPGPVDLVRFLRAAAPDVVFLSVATRRSALETAARIVIPSKAGVGCSTIALNTSIMLAQQPGMKVLLADFDLNCGLIGFMLQLETPYSVVSAAENAHAMDEDLWQRLVTTRGQLDVLPAGPFLPGFRIEPTQIRYLLEFARRNYKAICLDLSGILEKFSLEILHESKEIFLVCTPEVPSLHLAREKMKFLRSQDLHGRVRVLLNRAQRRSMLPISEVEKLLGVPVFQTFPNDYAGVHRALSAGKSVNADSELGRGFRALAESISKSSQPAQAKTSLLDMLRFRRRPDPQTTSPSGTKLLVS